MKGTCAVFDGALTGTLLPEAIHRRGYDCVHVLSRPEHLELARKFADLRAYDDSIVFDGDEDRLVAWLREKNTRAVIPVMDVGSIGLTDRIGHLLHTRGNNPATTSLRRDKFAMIEAVRKAGLAGPPQIRSGNVEELAAWAESIGIWPLILKAPTGVGGINVTPCHSLAELRELCASMFGRMDAMSQTRVSEIIAQVLIDGHDVGVDTVSSAGRHHIVAVWKYEKVLTNGVPILSKGRRLLPYEGSIQEPLFRFVRDVLDAVDFRSGASHTDIKYTEHGPVLVEVNPRIIGAMAPRLITECTGRDPIEMLLDALLDRGRFIAYAGSPTPLQKQGATVFLLPTSAASLRAEGIAHVQSLRSFWKLFLRLPPGVSMPKPEGLLEAAGWVDLVHTSREVLAEDLATIRTLEESGVLYEPCTS